MRPCRWSLADMLKQYKSSCKMLGWRGLMAESVEALLAVNVRYCKFSFLENAIIERGLWQQLLMAPYCREEILMCICIGLWRNSLFCHCFPSFIMQWFPSVTKAKRKSLAELLMQLFYLKQKQYLKGWHILLIDGTKAAGWIVMTAAVSASITAYSTGKQNCMLSNVYTHMLRSRLSVRSAEVLGSGVI